MCALCVCVDGRAEGSSFAVVVGWWRRMGMRKRHPTQPYPYQCCRVQQQAMLRLRSLLVDMMRHAPPCIPAVVYIRMRNAAIIDHDCDSADGGGSGDGDDKKFTVCARKNTAEKS